MEKLNFISSENIKPENNLDNFKENDEVGITEEYSRRLSKSEQIEKVKAIDKEISLLEEKRIEIEDRYENLKLGGSALDPEYLAIVEKEVELEGKKDELIRNS